MYKYFFFFSIAHRLEESFCNKLRDINGAALPVDLIAWRRLTVRSRNVKLMIVHRTSPPIARDEDHSILIWWCLLIGSLCPEVLVSPQAGTHVPGWGRHEVLLQLRSLPLFPYGCWHFLSTSAILLCSAAAVRQEIPSRCNRDFLGIWFRGFVAEQEVPCHGLPRSFFFLLSGIPRRFCRGG